MNAVKWTGLALAVCLAAGTAGASVWHDDLDDGVVDLTNYEAWEAAEGLTLTEEGGILTMDPGSKQGCGYFLTAVEVEPGDTVRAVFSYAADYGSGWGWSGTGLVHTLGVRPMNDPVAFFGAKQARGWLRILQWNEDLGIGSQFGNVITQEIVLGQKRPDETFDVTMTVYDEGGTQLPSITKSDATTPTGNIYWVVGDSWAVAELHSLDIVPEPMSLAMAIGGAGALLRRR